MKTLILSALLGVFAAAASAEEAPPAKNMQGQAPAEPAQPSIMAPAEPAQPSIMPPVEPPQPAVETPAAPAAETPVAPAAPAAETPAVPAAPAVETLAVAPQPEVKAAHVPASLPELKKSHGQAVADLKKKQEEAIAQLKAAMKGKSIPEMRGAVGKQRTMDKTALKTLKDAQNAELEQFKKDHPKAVERIKEVKKQEDKAPAVPEKK